MPFACCRAELGVEIIEPLPSIVVAPLTAEVAIIRKLDCCTLLTTAPNKRPPNARLSTWCSSPEPEEVDNHKSRRLVASANARGRAVKVITLQEVQSVKDLEGQVETD